MFNIKLQAIENFTYAGIMFIVVFILMLLSIFYYEYKEIKLNDEEDEDEEEVNDVHTKEAKAEEGDGEIVNGKRFETNKIFMKESN